MIARVGRHLDRLAADHLYTAAAEGRDFGRIIGQQVYLGDTQPFQHAQRQGIVTHIIGEPEGAVGVDRIEPGLL